MKWLYCSHCHKIFSDDTIGRLMMMTGRHVHIEQDESTEPGHYVHRLYELTNWEKYERFQDLLEAYNRDKLYLENKDNWKEHRNEKCLNCNKPIDSSEWFCYCCLCTDCYMKDDEDVDSWLEGKEAKKEEPKWHLDW